MSHPEIVIVEGLVIRPGDVLVLTTNESESPEAIYQMRGQLSDYFKDMDVKVVIVCGASLTKLTKEEIASAYADQNRA